jgi:hypothetical protein
LVGIFKKYFQKARNVRIKAVLDMVLDHFICNVKYLPWPDPSSFNQCRTFIQASTCEESL